MKTLYRLVLLISLLAGVVGCKSPATGPSGADVVMAQSEKPRVVAAAPVDDIAALVDGNTAFAFDLYVKLVEGNGDNVFYSPYSISQALAMTYAGARGTTEQQMAETLHFALEQAALHPAFNDLDQTLVQRGGGAQGKDGEGFRLNVVNALWGQQGYEFLPAYLDVVAENYGAGLRLLDFAQHTEAARQTINAWVAEQTEDRIQDLLPQGSLDPLTRLVLTNAIYFNAAWAEPFEEGQTAGASFYLLDGSQVNAPMMHQATQYGYAEGAGYQAVELPYDGHQLAMVILKPDADSFAAFEQGLNGTQVKAILEQMRYQQVALAMPRFEMESEFSLAETLSALGMPDAFSGEADFSGMDGTRNLVISDVIHKAFVSVDEAGTEAAAATAVVMKLTSMPGEAVEVTLDHPFLFFIRDLETGAILFVGRVMNPTL